MSRTPTIADVAEKAGVSVSTVSRHLRGDRVRAAEKIDQAISHLRFRPSPAAQSLKSGRTGAIALVVPDIANPFFAAVVRGAESITAQGGHTIFLANTDESEAREAEVIEDLLGRVDGMLLTPASENNLNPRRLADAGVPTVLIDREAPSSGDFDAVLIDNYGGAGWRLNTSSPKDTGGSPLSREPWNPHRVDCVSTGIGTPWPGTGSNFPTTRSSSGASWNMAATRQ